MERIAKNKFDGYEVAPCLTLKDDGREPYTESYETIAERDAAIQSWPGSGHEDFWTLYGHRDGQGVEAIGDFTSERAALDVLYSITGANMLCAHGRSFYQLPERQSSVDLMDPAALASLILKNASDHLYENIPAGTQLDLCPEFRTIQWLEERRGNLPGGSPDSVYLIGDQPTTCPKCGARTEYKELDGGRQDHACMQCGFHFIAEPVRH